MSGRFVRIPGCPAVHSTAARIRRMDELVQHLSITSEVTQVRRLEQPIRFNGPLPVKVQKSIPCALRTFVRTRLARIAHASKIEVLSQKLTPYSWLSVSN